MESDRKLERVLDIIPPDPETMCPSCGGFTGTYDICPRCGAQRKKRMSLRFFRYFSLFLGIVGLFFLYLWATHREIQKIQVDDIVETMNFAYVRIEGKVIQDARVNYGSADLPLSLSFLVDDGTGTIRVRAFKHVTEELLQKGGAYIPRQSDHVSLCGVLRVRKGDDVSMMLQVADQLETKRTEIPLLPLSEVDRKYMGKVVRVEGRIRSLRTPGSRTKMPVLLELTDGKLSRVVKMWSNVYNAVLQENPLNVGDKVSLRCVVGEYRGQLQLSLNHPVDIKVLSATPAAAQVIPIKALAEKHLGRVVKIRGTIRKCLPRRGVRGPKMKWLLSDGTDSLLVTLWEKVYDALDAPAYREGVSVEVQGTLKRYRERMELTPDAKDDIQRVAPSKPVEPSDNPKPDKRNTPDKKPGDKTTPDKKPGDKTTPHKKPGDKTTPHKKPDETATYQPIAMITPASVGKRVIIRGRVTQQRPFKNGIRWMVKDDSGKSIKVILWKELFENKPGLDIGVGDAVKVQGQVAKFKQYLEIQVKRLSDVRKEK